MLVVAVRRRTFRPALDASPIGLELGPEILCLADIFPTRPSRCSFNVAAHHISYCWAMGGWAGTQKMLSIMFRTMQGSSISSKRNSPGIVVAVRRRTFRRRCTHYHWASSSDLDSCVWQTSSAARPFPCSFNVATQSYLHAVQWVGGLARKIVE